MAGTEHRSERLGMTRPGWKGHLSRMPILYEVNPWMRQDVLERALLYRGAIVAAWAAIDFRVSEIAVRCSKSEAYGPLNRQNLPYPLKKRLAYLEEVLKAPGPLSPYRNAGLTFLKRFDLASPFRHLMAHGYMSGSSGFGDVFQFEAFDLSDRELRSQGGMMVEDQRVALHVLERRSLQTCRLARISQKALYIIDTEALLPPRAE